MKAVVLLYCTGILAQRISVQNPTNKVNVGLGRSRFQAYEFVGKRAVVDPISLRDIFICVKTTHKNYDSRLMVILRTWYQLARGQVVFVVLKNLSKQTWFFTDSHNKTLDEYTDRHMITTGCGDSHETIDLCCKANVELDFYYNLVDKKWFCHFDDDTFVNVPRLLKVLQTYNHTQDWYLGKNSTNSTVVTLARVHFQTTFHYNASFMFATGGAYCISDSLMTKMAPYTRYGNFRKNCKEMVLADDVTVGYVIEVILQKNLTIVPEFRMQYEPLNELDPKDFKNQISFTYLAPSNYINFPGVDTRNDSTRFLSLYEYLFQTRPKASLLPAGGKPSIHRRKMLRMKYNPI